MATSAACLLLLATAELLGSAEGMTIAAHVDKSAAYSATDVADSTDSRVEISEENVHNHQFLTAEAAEHPDVAFHAFVQKHKRTYQHGSDEYHKRKALFQQRLAEVQAHNQKTEPRWKAATTKFSDMTDAERAVMRGYRKISHGLPHGSSLVQLGENGTAKAQTSRHQKTLPESKDWRHLQVQSNFRDQGSCGSCWAIATSSVLEAHYEIYSAKSLNGGKTRIFSPQQILECTPNPQECGGKGGCQGATVELGMGWILKNGVMNEDEAPYTAEDGQCPSHAHAQDSPQGPGEGDPLVLPKISQEFDDLGEGEQLKKVFMKDLRLYAGLHENARTHRTPVAPENQGGVAIGLVGYKTLASNEDKPLAEAVANYGPTAVSAAASAWYEYSTGVFDGCPKDAVVDHAIVAYGYGEDQGQKYWLIRNSWGSDWGEQGYIRILRHGDGDSYCGTDNDPSQGLGCKGGPPTVTVCGMCGILYDSVVPHFVGSPGNPAHASSTVTASLMRTEVK